MAYEYFDNGTFEGVYSQNLLASGDFGDIYAVFNDSTEQAFEGLKSGKIVYNAIPDLSVLERFEFYGTDIPNPRPAPIDIDFQKLYEITVRVYIPSAARPFDSDFAVLLILSGNDTGYSLDPALSQNGNVVYKSDLDGGIIYGKQQSEAIDQWVELKTQFKFEFNNATQEIEPVKLCLYASERNGVGFNTGDVVNDGGTIFVDNVTFSEAIVETCGLNIPNPQVEVKAETFIGAEGNRDGQIEVFIDKPGSTVEYKLDGAIEGNNIPYQTGNIFNGLRADTYTLTVRVDGTCEYVVQGIRVPVVEIKSPAPLIIKDLPNRHQVNVACDLREMEPIFVPGERYSNMVNSVGLLVGVVADAAALKLSFIDLRGNLVADDIATITLYDSNGVDARLAWDIPVFPNLKPGQYRIVIYEEVGEKLYLVSNIHRVVTNKKYIIEQTAKFVYSHTAKLYRENFPALPDFKIRTRLPINAVAYNYPFDAKEYEEVSTGESQNERFDVDVVVELETELYDEKAHRAFAAFLAHNKKQINELVYVVDGGATYEQDRDKNSYLWNGTIRLVEQQFSTINKQ